MTVRNATLLPLGALTLGGISGAVGWAQSYPVALSARDDLLWNHISAWFWVGVVLAAIALATTFALRSGPRTSGVVCVGIALAWSGPSYLFVVAGSDTPGVLALTEIWRSTGQMDAQQYEYFQWPSAFLIIGVVQAVTGLGLPASGHVVFAITVAIMGIALFWFYGADYIAAAATGLFLTITAPFLNWQLAPQVMAFAVFILLVQLASQPKNRWEVAASIALFVFLCFTHPFVSVWFIAYALIVWTVRRMRPRERFPEHQHSVVSPLLLVAVQATVTVYVGTSLLLSVSDAVKRIGAALESGGSLATAASFTLIGQVSASADYVLVIALSVGAAVAAGAAIVIGMFVSARQHRFALRDIALILVGTVHFVAGLIGPFLGGRGLQVVALPLPGAIRQATVGASRRAVVGRSLVVACLLLSPAPLIAGSRLHTQYLSEAQLDTGQIAAANLDPGDHVLGSNVLVSYLALRSGPGVEIINPRYADDYLLHTPGVMPQVVVWSPELEIDLLSSPTIDPDTYYGFVREHYKLVHSRENVGVWTLAGGP